MPPTSCRSSSKKSWAFCDAKICQVRSYGFAPAQPESCAFQICPCQSCFECFRDPSDQPELCIKRDHIFPIVPHGISVLCPVPDVPALWDVVGLDDPFCCVYPVLSTIPKEITVSQLVLVALITVNSGKITVITLITFITLIIKRSLWTLVGDMGLISGRVKKRWEFAAKGRKVVQASSNTWNMRKPPAGFHHLCS